MQKILVTDSLFIHDEHVARLAEAGYEVERIDTPEPTEQQLIEGIKGKVGYILGGIEHVNERILDAADALRVISVCGIGYKGFVPAWQYATERGIAITNTPGSPTHAVTEWALMVALMMNRHALELGRTGTTKFMTTPGLEGARIGIVGYGHIGQYISQMIRQFRPGGVSYYSAHEHPEIAGQHGAVYQPLEMVLATSDVVFLCVSNDAGNGFFDAEKLSKMKDGALLVSFMHSGIVDEAALLKELKTGRIRAVSDYPMEDPAFGDLPLSHWFGYNGSNAFNTMSEIVLTSDMAVTSILNVLTNGDDQYLVNPNYKKANRGEA